MEQELKWTGLVRRAQKGQKEDINKLAQEAEGRLCAYIYRVTLNYDLTQDMSQEVLLQMIKSLNQLNSVESFWPWLYRITQNKIQEFYKFRLASGAKLYRPIRSLAVLGIRSSLSSLT